MSQSVCIVSQCLSTCRKLEMQNSRNYAVPSQSPMELQRMAMCTSTALCWSDIVDGTGWSLR